MLTLAGPGDPHLRVPGLTAGAALLPGGGLFSADYLPHRYCYLAQPGLVWTNVVADGLIAVAYAVIFTLLMRIAVRLNRLAEFRSYVWIFFSFGVFILACGGTHWMEMVTVWWPFYPLSAMVKVVCAAASVGTAVLFWRAEPSLATNARHFLDILAATERQRDGAVFALDRWKMQVEERHAAANQLAIAYAQLNTALECTNDMVMTLGFDWTVLYGNRKTLASLPDFKVGASYWTCFPAVIGTEVEEKLRASMEQRVETGYEIFYEPYARWFRARVFPSSDGISIFFTDTTEERALREQLEEEQMLREKRIEALSHMAGGLAHEISNPLAIIHARASDLREAAARAETTKQAALEAEAKAVRAALAIHAVPAKAMLTVQATSARDALAGQATEAMVALAEHASAAEAAVAEAALGAELSLVAVEEAKLLAVRAAHAAEAAAAEISIGAVLEVCTSIVNTSDRAIRILRGLRGFGREASQDPMEWALMHDILDQAVEMQTARYERHDVKLIVEVEGNLPLLRCRETQVGQIVTNLLNNAFDAIEQSGSTERWVRAAAKACDGEICLDVTDSGPGVPTEFRSHLMEAFFTTKKMGLGMGVGLSLSRAIAQDHGGSLDLLADTEHTCFRLRLPIGSEEASR